MGSAMRWSLLVLLAACSSSSAHSGPDAGNLGCPEGVTDITCNANQEGMVCFVQNMFSTCDSGWYRCSGGGWVFDHGLGAMPGQPCSGAPISSCFVEGQPDCSSDPTAESCNCGSDGLWHCSCACYGTQTTCPLDCPQDFPGGGASGAACADTGKTCTYPGHSCTCESDGHFSCT
jgi:hypothetical protein